MAPSDKDTMEGFLDRSVADIKADLDGVNNEDLAQAIKLEQAGQNRSSLIEALAKQLEAQGGDPKQFLGPPERDPAQPTDAEGGKAARGEETPAWKKPDYDGPLTLEIARWRNRNLTQK